jgi:hypothetical protein
VLPVGAAAVIVHLLVGAAVGDRAAREVMREAELDATDLVELRQLLLGEL